MLPIEYTHKTINKGYGESYRTEHERSMIVHDRIKEALQSQGIDFSNFTTKVIHANYKNYFTRVYIGYSGKKMISSKANQSIDIDKVVEAIKEKIAEQEKESEYYYNLQKNRDTANTTIDAIEKEYNLTYASGIYLSATDGGQIQFTFKKTMTAEEVKAMLNLLSIKQL